MAEQEIEPWKPGYRVWFDAPADLGRDVRPGWQLGTVVPADPGWRSEPEDIFVKLDYRERVVRVMRSLPEHMERLLPVELQDQLVEMPGPPIEEDPVLLPSPYQGSTVAPEDAGVQTPQHERGQEHRKGGMLWGRLVSVHYASPHQQAQVLGRIVDFSSVPAAHIVIEYDDRQGRPTKMILFTTVITSISPATEDG
jgi:hypothetical protein